MATITRNSEALLHRLLELAERPEVLEQALVELSGESKEPPTRADVIRRILELKQRATAGHRVTVPEVVS